MKYLFAVIVFLFICMSTFAAVEITVEGSGKTLTEAKDNARVALAEKVFPGTVVVETSTSLNDSSSGDYSSSFSQKSSYSIVGEFPGLDYEVVSSKRNNYVVSVTIAGDTATLNFYASRLNEQKENVEEFYSRYKAFDSSVSVTERRKALALVIEYYYYYNMYSNIILSLGGIPDDVDIPTTLAVLQVDYQSLLDEEENELLTKSSVNAITQEIREELAKNAEAQEEYRKAQKEARAQSELQRRLILDQKIANIVNNASSITFDDVDTKPGLESYTSYLEVIKSADISFVEACKEYDKLIKEQIDSIEKAFNEEAEAIRNRTYPLAYIGKDGNPISDAKELREKEVDELRIQKDEEKCKAIETINTKLCDEIQKRYDYLVEVITQFQKEEFTVSSISEGASLSYQWDGANYSWLLSVYFPNVNVENLKDIELKYTDITGRKIPTNKDKRLKLLGSGEYTETIEKYNKLLLKGQYSFSVSFKATIAFDGELTISFTRFEITFEDGKKVEIKNINKSIEGDSVKLEGSAYQSYVWLKKSTIFKNKTENNVIGKKKLDNNFGFVIDMHFSLISKSLFNTYMKSASDISLEGKLYYRKAFVSASYTWTFWDVSGLLSQEKLLQTGCWGGAGYSFQLPWNFAKGELTVASRIAFNSELGILLDPYVMLGLEWHNIRVAVLFDFYINFKSRKTSPAIGLSLGWRFF